MLMPGVITERLFTFQNFMILGEPICSTAHLTDRLDAETRNENCIETNKWGQQQQHSALLAMFLAKDA